MQFRSALLSATALLAGSAVAQNVQSGPFALFVYGNTPYNGTSVALCHESSALFSMCLGQSGSNTAVIFHTNTTNGENGQSSVSGDTAPGLLTYEFRGPVNESESMKFYVEPTTNVAHPQLSPGNAGAQYISFDKQNRLNIVSFYNDTVTPPQDAKAVAYYRWYACQTNYIGYTYTTVNWVLGNGKPQNPSCVPVTVKRAFAPSTGPA